MKQTWVKDAFYSIWWSSLFLPTPLIAVNFYFLVSLFHFILINSNSVYVCIYIGYPLVLNFSPSFPCNRPLKTAIWKKWKRKYGLRNEKDEEMWIKIPQKKMWKKLRRDEVALPQRNCHQTPPNWQSRWMPSSILWSTTKTGECLSPSPWSSSPRPHPREATSEQALPRCALGLARAFYLVFCGFHSKVCSKWPLLLSCMMFDGCLEAGV